VTGPAVRAVDSSASTFVDPPGFDFKDLRAQTLQANCSAGAMKSR
jgi:hypothetical protein